MRREKDIEFNWTDEVVLTLLPMRREKGDRVQLDGRSGFDAVANET